MLKTKPDQEVHCPVTRKPNVSNANEIKKNNHPQLTNLTPKLKKKQNRLTKETMKQ